jgi:hypothetical protein
MRSTFDRRLQRNTLHADPVVYLAHLANIEKREEQLAHLRIGIPFLAPQFLSC